MQDIVFSNEIHCDAVKSDKGKKDGKLQALGPRKQSRMWLAGKSLLRITFTVQERQEILSS